MLLIVTFFLVFTRLDNVLWIHLDVDYTVIMCAFGFFQKNEVIKLVYCE